MLDNASAVKVPVLNAEGKEVSTRDVLGEWAHRPLVPALLHQAVVTARANLRRPWAHTKNRGEVRGGGRKPWKQKGTGRARHGSIRSPLWKGGGVTFGPRADETYAKRLPAGMRRVALGMALAAKARDAELRLVERFPETAKTKDLASFVQRLGLRGSILFLTPGQGGPLLARASRNLPNMRVTGAVTVTAADVLQSKYLVATPDSWAAVERRIGAAAAVSNPPLKEA